MLTGNTILITGGGSGVGLQLAGELIKNNNKVLVCGRSEEKLQQAKHQLPSLEIFSCDLSQEKECLRLFEWVERFHPSCNVLINNAAVAHEALFDTEQEVVRMAEEEFQVNVLTPVRLSKLFLPLLMKNKNAHLINITTGLIYVPRVAYPFYNATKAALHSFTQVLRVQLAGKPIRVTEVLLPVVDTPWHRETVPRSAIPVEKAVKEMLSGINKGKQEVRVGLVAILYWLVRIAPGFAFRKINAL